MLSTTGEKTRPVPAGTGSSTSARSKSMPLIAPLLAGEKGQHALLAAPSDGMYGILAILKRPMPLGALRPAALASGLTMAQVKNAISIATRPGALTITANRDDTVLAIAGRRA
jgi:hypothetical protein